ncbi:MAG: DUF4349 domain-containing protein, partial [Actinomycetota bacterium]|nr:DUF4349 domain-containing protein [Actinomycetota bacterium]
MATEFTEIELNDPELEALAMSLRENRPLPEPEFADRLDQAVSDHFPWEWSRGRDETKAGLFGRVRSWLGESRSYLLPLNAGLVGLTIVVIAVGITISNNQGPSPEDPVVASTESASDAGGSAATEQSGRAIGNESYGGRADATERLYFESKPTYASKRFTRSGLNLTATGPFAAGVNNRRVAQEAEIALGTKPEDVQDVSNEVVSVVDDHNGIVLDSAVKDGPAGEAGARFSLMIPSDQLESAVSDLSGIADLRARNQETEDITAPTLTVEDSLQTAKAQVKSLVNELGEVTTDEDRARVEGELGQARRKVARLTTRLNKLERRANLTPVAVAVET